MAVFFDPLRTDYGGLVEWLERQADQLAEAPIEERPSISVPVCYGGELGPDLAAVAAFANMSPQDVITIHASATYRVFMLGFMPGFAYMGVLDPRIAMPRRSTPRVRVPCGAVGIAGSQTGIYPAETPGGWQLIGRTPLKPFDRDPPGTVPVPAGRCCPIRADRAGRIRAGDRVGHKGHDGREG